MHPNVLRRIVAVSILVVSACAPTAVPATHVDPPGPPSVAGTLELANPAPSDARLVLAWLRPEEVASFPNSAALLVDLFPRFEVHPLEVGASRVPYTLTLREDGPWQVYAMVLGSDNFFRSLLDAPSAMDQTGMSPSFEDPTQRIDFVLARGRDGPPRPERCQGERRRLVHVDAPYTAGTIDNDPHRRICVVLPVGYDDAPTRRYPTVYLMNGLGGDDTTYLSIVEALTDASPAIYVGVDGRTRTGTSYFTSSAISGDFDHLLADILDTVDARFRTIADAEHRGLAGHSTGGFNAIALLLRHPEHFGAAGASSPDGLDFHGWLFEQDSLSQGARVRGTWLAWTRFEVALERGGQMLSYAADFNPSDAATLVWPFDLSTGIEDPARWAASWGRYDPIVLVDARSPEMLADRIFITVGEEDEFGLYPPARAFHEHLDARGIAHEFVAVPNAGHFDRRDGIEAAVRFVSRRLAR